MTDTGIDLRQDQWRRGQVAHGTHAGGVISLSRLSDWLLYIAAPLSLFRSTQMWPGWPTAQTEFTQGYNFNMSVQLYVLLLLCMGYIYLNQRAIIAAVAASGLLLRIFLTFVFISIVASIDIPVSILNLLSVSVLSLPCIFFYWRFGPTRTLEMFRLFAMVTITINIVYGVLQPHYAYMSGSLAGDFRGLFPHKNGFGHTMAFMVIALLPIPGQKSLYAPSQLLRIFFVLLGLGCIEKAHSSTAFVLIAVGIAVMVSASIIRALPGKGFRTAVSIMLFLGLVLTLSFGALVLASNIAAGAGKDLTFSGRTYIWAALIPHLLDHPVTGFGFGTMRQDAYIGPFLAHVGFGVNSPHNTYLELSLNMGIPGAAAWIFFLLGRLLQKFVQRSPNVIENAVHNREAAIIVMTMIASLTEAGRMLAPTSNWPILALALPLWSPTLRSRLRGGANHQSGMNSTPINQALVGHQTMPESAEAQ